MEELTNLLKAWFEQSIYDFPESLNFNETKGKWLLSPLDDFAHDYERYFNSTEMRFHQVKSRPELQAILLYRISRSFFLQGSTYCDAFSLLGRFLSGIEIYYSAVIGKGVKINHGIGTVVGARVVIGSNCLIHQGVTFGDKDGHRPLIGDNVTVYAGAKIIGNVSVGDNAVIGANSVVLKDVPPNSTAAGIPARILSRLNP